MSLTHSSRKFWCNQIVIFCQKTVLPENLQPLLINIFLSCALGILENECRGAVHCNVFPTLCDIILLNCTWRQRKLYNPLPAPELPPPQPVSSAQLASVIWSHWRSELLLWPWSGLCCCSLHRTQIFQCNPPGVPSKAPIAAWSKGVTCGWQVCRPIVVLHWMLLAPWS